jgi:bifunctional non-homologous end joining protein LigD
MLATSGRLPAGPLWRYEVRWGGLRVIAEIADGKLRLTTVTERDVTAFFPEFAPLGGRLRDGLLDGEIVILDGGVPSPSAARERLRVQRPLADGRDRPSALMLCDVLRLYGVPLLHRRFDERRATLERLGLDDFDRVVLSPVYDDGLALLAATRRQRLAGVIAKRVDAPYRPGVRDPSWVQVTGS